jgi:hypothetical protein
VDVIERGVRDGSLTVAWSTREEAHHTSLTKESANERGSRAPNMTGVTEVE